jgi:cytochrome c peroxidase
MNENGAAWIFVWRVLGGVLCGAVCVPAADRPPPLPVDPLPVVLVRDTAPQGLDLRRTKAAAPPTAAQVQLGRRLFFDGRLSQDGTVSCATCHRPDHGFASGEPRAIGIRGQVGERSAPSLLIRRVVS